MARADLRVHGECAWRQTSSSLRANGSRECAPDDRLREAIQLGPTEQRLDCVVAYAPRNDGAETTKTAFQ
jgi:hypothetical protein